MRGYGQLNKLHGNYDNLWALLILSETSELKKVLITAIMDLRELVMPILNEIKTEIYGISLKNDDQMLCLINKIKKI